MRVSEAVKRPSVRAILQRLRWDLLDARERQYFGYWLIWQIPGAAGNLMRARYLSPRMKRAGGELKVYAGCRFRSLENLEVGDNVSIGYDNFIQARGGLRIGSHVATAPGVKIWTVNHDYDDPDIPVLRQGQSEKGVIIENNVFIASNAFILPGTTLSEGSIVSAGAVVGGKSYPPFAMLAGNPARVIGYRGGRSPAAARTPISPVTAPDSK